MTSTFPLVLLASLALAVSARAQVTGYEWVYQSGRNNLVDSNASSCDEVEGCYTRTGRRCAETPGQICDLQIVPPGRCTYGELATGTESCVWPRNAGRCASNPRVGCLSDAFVANPVLANAVTGPSAMCSGLATNSCDMTIDKFGDAQTPAEIVACRCQGTDPTAAAFETSVCGGAERGVCSDGDPERDSGGYGLAFGWHLWTGATPGDFGELGPNVNGAKLPATSPRYPIENPPTLYDPQRGAGTIGRGGTGAIQRARTTDARGVLPLNATLGVDFLYRFGDSFWSDWRFERYTTTGTFNTHYALVACDAPSGWSTDDALHVGPSPGLTPVGLPDDTDAYPPFDPESRWCSSPFESTQHPRGARDAFAILWQRDLTPAELAANPACPPNCRKDFDLTTLEVDAIRQVADADLAAGAQLALQSGEGRQAGAGDALSFTSLRMLRFIIDGDARCRLGGWGNAPGFIGRCSDGPTACIPGHATSGDTLCLGEGGSCRACNGPIDPANTDLENDAPNHLGLPPGYDPHGADGLDLVAGQRIGMLADFGADISIPVHWVGTTGASAAEFRDVPNEGTPFPSDRDSAALGEIDTSVGAPPWGVGIGAGGSFADGTTLPIGIPCCATGASISWNPELPGTVRPGSVFLRTFDAGPGPGGIPACIGDNPRYTDFDEDVVACDRLLGVGPVLSPELSSGVDDLAVKLLLGGPVEVPVSVARFGVREAGLCGPPPVTAPAFNQVTALALRDQSVFVPLNTDLLLKHDVSYCPIIGGVARCHDADCFPDADGDGILDSSDNCPTVPNADQADGDADGVGSVCDSCSAFANPRVAAGYLVTNPWATLTGGQRDDDHDGYGNRCDGKFPGVAGTLVGAGDLTQFRASSGRNRTGDTCGTSGTRPCAIFDLDELSTLIGAGDLTRFRMLTGKVPGPKCAVCPLPCEAGTTGTCGAIP